MTPKLIPVKDAIRAALKKQSVSEPDFIRFRQSLSTYFTQLDEARKQTQGEEHTKKLFTDLLKGIHYSGDQFYLNTVNYRGLIGADLVIRKGKTAASPAQVLIEVKRPDNKVEMISPDQFEKKAFYELVLYYLFEKEHHNNHELKSLIITNGLQIYLFDAETFAALFFRNTELLSFFKTWKNGQADEPHTQLMFEVIRRKMAESDADIPFTLIDLPAIKSGSQSEQTAVYRLLSPFQLLKEPVANDSNSLNRDFYLELLHIIGLEEKKDGSKKIIDRKDVPDEGSFLENTLQQIRTLDRLVLIPNLTQYGDTKEKQAFSIALELVITWLNRILFLKLLEAQLKTYHNGDPAYSFLNHATITEFDDLQELFFEVLAVPEENRSASVSAKFGHIPYLNSSLFEITDLERQILSASQLKDRLTLPLWKNTVLITDGNKRLTGDKPALQYLFEFLNAFAFATDSAEEIRPEAKTLINASVLGLIFEKINGYKDGSFFTPGYITMYMSREALRRSVTDKFNSKYGWSCSSLTDIHNQIWGRNLDLKDANAVINSLKICDPAVGSGHFLVSSLNELIAIKSELGILADRSGRSLAHVKVEVENDELLVTWHGDLFRYQMTDPESCRIQESLFHEKQTLIENCLFGVDINPKSVMICRLRLWVELLKNAYYKTHLPAGRTERQLETLPNIDINIKCGNSLISRFALNADLKEALKRSKHTIDSYRDAIKVYRHAETKDVRREMERLIGEIKTSFQSEITRNAPKAVKLYKLAGELTTLTTQTGLFGMTDREKKDWTKQVDKLTAEVKKLEVEIEDIRSNKIYENAFEWRFEFPEVLNDEGEFVGFDVVIGNPPYIRQEELTEFKPLFQSTFSTFAGTADLYVYFVEQGLRLLKPNGEFAFILPNKWMRTGYGKALRIYLKDVDIRQISDFGDLPVFEEATTYPCILEIRKTEASDKLSSSVITSLGFPEGLKSYLEANSMSVQTATLREEGWVLSGFEKQALLEKIRGKGVTLGKWVNEKIYRGLLTGLNEAFVINSETRNRLIAEDPLCEEIIKPFLAGRDIKRYQVPVPVNYLILFKNGETRKWFGQVKEPEAWALLCKKYPSVTTWLKPFEEKAKIRQDQGEFWWELRACAYYEEFEKPKLVLPDIALKQEITFDVINSSLGNTSYFIPFNDNYLLGLLNSQLVYFFYSQLTSTIRGGYLRFIRQYLEQIPIQTPDETRKTEIENLVDQILLQKKTNPQADTTEQERQIDRLVYELYDLTEEEIRVVEGE